MKNISYYCKSNRLKKRVEKQIIKKQKNRFKIAK